MRLQPLLLSSSTVGRGQFYEAATGSKIFRRGDGDSPPGTSVIQHQHPMIQHQHVCECLWWFGTMTWGFSTMTWGFSTMTTWGFSTMTWGFSTVTWGFATASISSVYHSLQPLMHFWRSLICDNSCVRYIKYRSTKKVRQPRVSRSWTKLHMYGARGLFLWVCCCFPSVLKLLFLQKSWRDPSILVSVLRLYDDQNSPHFLCTLIPVFLP